MKFLVARRFSLNIILSHPAETSPQDTLLRQK